jgi:3-methyladenine DNA glycosylase AlkD
LIVEELQNQLRNAGNAETQRVSQTFFKEEIRGHGVKKDLVRALAKASFTASLKTASVQEVFELCEELWQTGMIEESFAACEWAFALRRKMEAEDFARLEHWAKNYVSNWAVCDELCVRVVGAFLERFPEFVARLEPWATSANRWVRRASAVSLIPSVRKGLFLEQTFATAERLLHDSDDLVQKGYGWLLKVASAKNPDRVLNFVLEHSASMPRTALRYAIEKFPESDRQLAMAKRSP